MTFNRASGSKTVLTAVNTYAGETILAADSGLSTNTLQMGIANAINPLSGLNFSNTGNLGGLLFDLNNSNQTVAYLASGNPSNSAANYFIVNNGSGTATLTVANGNSTLATQGNGTVGAQTFTNVLANNTNAGTGILAFTSVQQERKRWAARRRTPSPG